jgi:uncharacterized membrane protein
MIFFALLVIGSLVAHLIPGRRNRSLRETGRIGFGLAFAIAGLTHFFTPTPFVQHIPEWIPLRLELIYVTGAFEFLGGGALVFWSRYRREIGILIALYLVAVFPSNIYVAVAGIDVTGQPDGIYSWIRLPFQPVYILWVLWSVDALRRDMVASLRASLSHH